MKLRSVLQAESVRFFVREGSFGYAPEAVRAIAERYGFVGSPTTFAELFPPDPNQGTTFRHGRFVLHQKTIVVDQLQVFAYGLIARTTTSTTDSDLFLDDLTKWATEQFAVTLSPLRPSAYASQLEVEFSHALSDYFPSLRDFSRSISELLPEFWSVKPEYEVAGISFAFDTVKFPTPVPGIVRIERRAQLPYDANLYFSDAPLRTPDHVSLLEAFERSVISPDSSR